MELTQYDFRRAVVPRGDDLGVVLPVEGRRAEVDQLHPASVGGAGARRSTTARPVCCRACPRLPGQTHSAKETRQGKGYLFNIELTR